MVIEEHMRTQAIDFARSAEQIPWGLAISMALKEDSEIWHERKELLRGTALGCPQPRPPLCQRRH